MTTLREFLADANASDIKSTLPVDHLSVSQLKMLETCQEQYRQRYVLGIKSRPGAALIIGSAFHKATEQNYLHNIETGGWLHESGVAASFHQAWDAELDKYGGVNEVEWDAREKPDTARLNGETVSKLYAERVAPKYVPEAVERDFSLDLPGVPVPVVGFVDLLADAQVGTDRDLLNDTTSPHIMGVAADYKTTARAQRTLKPEWVLQGKVYQVAVKRPVEWHVVVKGSKPNVITPADTSDLFQFEEPGTEAFVTAKFHQAAACIAWLMREFGPDQPWPTSGFTHPFACAWCGYKKTCPAFGGAS